MADENFFCFQRKSGWMVQMIRTGKINTFINGRYNKTSREVIYEFIYILCNVKGLQRVAHYLILYIAMQDQLTDTVKFLFFTRQIMLCVKKISREDYIPSGVAEQIFVVVSLNYKLAATVSILLQNVIFERTWCQCKCVFG